MVEVTVVEGAPLDPGERRQWWWRRFCHRFIEQDVRRTAVTSSAA
jgi:hypothetical protein